MKKLKPVGGHPADLVTGDIDKLVEMLRCAADLKGTAGRRIAQITEDHMERHELFVAWANIPAAAHAYFADEYWDTYRSLHFLEAAALLEDTL